jgi:hypothetical protein
MAGGILAFVKRSKEARKAVLDIAKEETARGGAPVPATGPALPAHTRSRVE